MENDVKKNVGSLAMPLNVSNIK
eukprot:SAG31_NODE_19474_length_600_cov_1.704591_1_plen_22_part_10